MKDRISEVDDAIHRGRISDSFSSLVLLKNSVLFSSLLCFVDSHVKLYVQTSFHEILKADYFTALFGKSKVGQ